jgi:hypothetical protein
MGELSNTLTRVLLLRHRVYSFAKDTQQVYAEMFLLETFPVNRGQREVFHVNLKTTVQTGQIYECRFLIGISGALFDDRHHNEVLRVEIAKWADWLDKDTTIKSEMKPLIYQAWEGFLQ